MGAHSHLDLSPPRSWDAFEELCADTFAAEWRDPSLVRNGRAGQAQHGVDIVAADGSRWPVGIQCKRKSRWPVAKLSVAELNAEVERAKGFRPKLKAFYLVTTAPPDAVLDARARELTKAQLKAGSFSVTVVGWHELVRRSTLHRAVAAKHFGAFGGDPPAPLLANWRARRGKLLMKDDELSIAVREIVHDLRLFPAGRLGLRQVESEDLLHDVARRREAGTSLTDRLAVLTLRDRLRTLEIREQRISTGLRMVLGYGDLPSYLTHVWPEEAPLFVRSFVERELDPKLGVVTGLEKIRVRPPGDDTESFAVFLSSARLRMISDIKDVRRKRFGKPLTNTVDELPEEVRAAAVLPSILSWLVQAVDEGSDPRTLRDRGLLSLGQWGVST